MSRQITDTTMVEVLNMAGQTVVFKDEVAHRRIVFEPHAIMKLEAGMLRRLNYTRGGKVLLQDFLSVKNAQLAEEFGIDTEEIVEYNWTKEDVDVALKDPDTSGLEDALEFAPIGIKELIADRAVELKIADMKIRKLIQDATGQDVDKKIRLIEESATITGETKAAAPKKTTRRRKTTATPKAE